MRDAFVWIEHSALGEFMRTSSLWTYAIVNVLHVLGIASLFGATVIMDLRLLGMWQQRAATDGHYRGGSCGRWWVGARDHDRRRSVRDAGNRVSR